MRFESLDNRYGIVKIILFELLVFSKFAYLSYFRTLINNQVYVD